MVEGGELPQWTKGDNMLPAKLILKALRDAECTFVNLRDG